MTEERLTYRFGPLERRGLLGPVRIGQALTIATGAIVAMLALDQLPSAAGALLAITTVAFAATLATLPVAGRTIESWTPVCTGFGLRLAIGHGRFRAALPSTGTRLRSGRLFAPKPELPPTLTGIGIVDVDHRDGRIGAVSELRGRRLTAVLACRAESFALLDPPAQERRVAHWGSLLTSAASAPIRRLQWIERTAPAQGDELARWLHTARDPALPLRGAPIVESYLELISAGTRVTHAHEVLLALQVEGSGARGRGADSARLALVEQVDRIARALEGAEVRVLGALGAGPLARAIRTAFDPYARAELTALETVDPARRDLALHSAGPLGTQEHWDRYRCDGACHATYWIASWPRSEVSTMFLDPLLGGSETVRAVAVTFEPVPPERSTREVEAAITRDRADTELRRRFGQTETARHRQAQEAARRREAELAAGHGEVRLSGFVTVSGRDDDELRLACDELCQQAARARLELHRMYGQQAQAFTFTLPLARGLR